MIGVLSLPTVPGMMNLLAWRPFLDPLNLHELWWVLLIPMSLGIAVVYKAVRVASMKDYWREVGIMTAQIVLAMILLGLAVYVFIEFYVNSVAEYAG